MNLWLRSPMSTGQMSLASTSAYSTGTYNACIYHKLASRYIGTLIISLLAYVLIRIQHLLHSSQNLNINGILKKFSNLN